MKRMLPGLFSFTVLLSISLLLAINVVVYRPAWYWFVAAGVGMLWGAAGMAHWLTHWESD